MDRFSIARSFTKIEGYYYTQRFLLEDHLSLLQIDYTIHISSPVNFQERRVGITIIHYLYYLKIIQYACSLNIHSHPVQQTHGDDFLLIHHS